MKLIRFSVLCRSDPGPQLWTFGKRVHILPIQPGDGVTAISWSEAFGERGEVAEPPFQIPEGVNKGGPRSVKFGKCGQFIGDGGFQVA